MTYNIYWGDMHTQFNLAHMRLQAEGVDSVAEPPDDLGDCERFVRRAFEGAREYSVGGRMSSGAHACCAKCLDFKGNF